MGTSRNRVWPILDRLGEGELRQAATWAFAALCSQARHWQFVYSWLPARVIGAQQEF
jgi:hypothetical protein